MELIFVLGQNDKRGAKFSSVFVLDDHMVLLDRDTLRFFHRHINGCLEVSDGGHGNMSLVCPRLLLRVSLCEGVNLVMTLSLGLGLRQGHRHRLLLGALLSQLVVWHCAESGRIVHKIAAISV